MLAFFREGVIEHKKGRNIAYYDGQSTRRRGCGLDGWQQDQEGLNRSRRRTRCDLELVRIELLNQRQG